MKHADMPQPPDEFWDELSARVHHAVAAEPPPSRWRWPVAPIGRVVWQPALALAVAVLITVAATVLVMRRVGPVADARPARASADATASATVPPASVTTTDGVELAPDDPLDLMAALSTGLDGDEASAAGLMVSPAGVQAAVVNLSEDQRAELVRLLQEQLQQ